MIGFHIAHQCHSGLELEQRPVVLVGLDHEQLVLAEARIALPRGDPPAHEGGRIGTRCRQCLCHHGGRGGLAVRTGHGHDLAGRNDLAQGVRPGHHRDARGPSRLQLGMVTRHRRSINHCTRTVYMARVVSRRYLGTHAGQLLGARRVGITSGDWHPAAQRDERQRTHPGARYPHEMDGPGIVRGE